MDAYDFFALFTTAIAQSTAIADWTAANFGRPLKLYVDVEGGALPQASDMPYAIFHTPGVQRHQERREQIHTIAVDLALDTSARQPRAESNAQEPAGIQLVIDLHTLVVAAVKAALPANTAFGYTLSADTLGALPEVHGYMDFEFTTRVTIAGDPLA
jgi:hypothetical protein